MEDRTTRIVLGLLACVFVWVGVYWWWPVSPPVSFAVVASQGLGEHATGGLDDTSLRSAQGTIAPKAITSDGSPGTNSTPAPQAPGTQSTLVPASSQASKGVVKPRFLTHVVATSETLESISLAYFGTRDYAGAIARANPMLSPPDLRAGRELLIPVDPLNVQGLPASSTPVAPAQASHTLPDGLPQEYMVQAGDSLARIARQIYGSEQLADIIFAANRDQLSEPSRIKVGQRLRIPPKPVEPSPKQPSLGDAGAGGGR